MSKIGKTGVSCTAVAVALSMIAISASSAKAETLDDYAKIKTAPCFSQCERSSLKLGIPEDLIPNRGAVMEFSGEFARGFGWSVVDFEKSIIIQGSTAIEFDASGKVTESHVSSFKEVELTREELSRGIALANAVWRKEPPRPKKVVRCPGDCVIVEAPRLPDTCPGSSSSFVLLDRDQAISDFGMCPFAQSLMNPAAAVFARWAGSIVH